MDTSTGDIKKFDSEEKAVKSNYKLGLKIDQAEELLKMPPEERKEKIPQ